MQKYVGQGYKNKRDDAIHNIRIIRVQSKANSNIQVHIYTNLTFQNMILNLQAKAESELKELSLYVKPKEDTSSRSQSIISFVFSPRKISKGVEFPRSGYRVNEFGLDHDTIQSSHSDLSPSITMFAFMRAAAASRISDCNSVIVIVLIRRGALLGFPLGR